MRHTLHEGIALTEGEWEDACLDSPAIHIAIRPFLADLCEIDGQRYKAYFHDTASGTIWVRPDRMGVRVSG